MYGAPSSESAVNLIYVLSDVFVLSRINPSYVNSPGVVASFTAFSKPSGVYVTFATSPIIGVVMMLILATSLIGITIS